MAGSVLAGGPRRTARRALDRRFEDLRDVVRQALVPHGGWVQAIREALGMTAADLGTRMGIVETSVLRLERSERAGRVRLDTLQRAADALDCDLVYALVPRRPLESMVDDRARVVAESLLGTVGHSMMLEDQQVRPETARDQLHDQIERVRDQPGLWRDA
jgi:predicted DNA-binding mobile mystery protein A